MWCNHHKVRYLEVINHNILSTKSFVHDGSDCRIYECVTLIEVTETHYIVLHTTKVIGWCADEYTTIQIFDNKASAGKHFNNVCR